MITVTSSFSKSSVFKCFPSTPKHKAGVSEFLRFEERFRDGLVWTVVSGVVPGYLTFLLERFSFE